MKAIMAGKLAGSALIVVMSVNIWAQPGDPAGPEPPAPTASAAAPSGGGAKSARQANRSLSRKVRTALVRTPDISATDIKVIVKNGAVTLAGSVPEAAQIDKAGEVAKDVPGVTSVKNALAVKPRP